MARNIESYMERHGFCAPRISQPPESGLGLVVVIPALAEPDLPATLGSLWAAQAPACAVEVIVVINAAEDAASETHRLNETALTQVEQWARKYNSDRLRLYALNHPALPPRHAGVGLARKIGMDEAAARLGAAGSPQGIIAGLDADCICAPNYLRALENHFQAHPVSPACSVYFEHDFDALADPMPRAGIIHYELFLRYHNLALKFAGHPFAFHTLGSCMAVRADAYIQQGGMNRRKAAEDFYFLGKFMALGGFTDIRDTVVYPSARVSGRVPFGTGKAMGLWQRGGGSPEPATHPRVFAELAMFLKRTGELYGLERSHLPAFLAGLPPAVCAYLEQARFAEAWVEMRANCATAQSFSKRFYRWFDRFRVLKYLHFADGRHHARTPLTQAYMGLLAWRGINVPGESAGNGALEGAEDMLRHARRMERLGETMPPPEAKTASIAAD